MPHRLVADQDRDAARAALLDAALRSLDSVLAEPIADCVYEAPDGSPCIEARTTADLEESLGMVGGDIFHGPLSWPWAEDDESLDSPAARWGVATGPPAGAAVRVGCAPRRRGERPRRPQRRDGRARAAARLRPPYGRRGGSGGGGG